MDLAKREKCPNTEFFLVRILLYQVRIHENTDQKNSEFGHFSRSVGNDENISFSWKVFSVSRNYFHKLLIIV